MAYGDGEEVWDGSDNVRIKVILISIVTNIELTNDITNL